MALDMDLVNTLFNKQHIKGNGFKVKNLVKVKLYSKVVVYFKVHLKMI